MTTRRLFSVLLAIALFAMAVRETIDPDIWWHLRTGESIVEQGMPELDRFSFTVPDHEWIVQEWLTDVAMWQIYQFGGLSALSVFFAAVAALAMLLVYARCDGRPYLAGFVVILALVTAAVPLGARPQMFNMLFLAAFIYLLEGIRARRIGRRWLWALPLLTAAWANMHSGYLSGVVLVAVYAVGSAAQQLTGEAPAERPGWRESGRYAVAAAVCLGAALLNPRSYELWLFPVGTLGSSTIQSYILDWRSPDFHQIHFWFFIFMMGLGVFAWLVSPRRPTLTEVLVFLGTAAAGLMSARHIPLFAVATPPIIARHLSAALESRPRYVALHEPPATRPKRTLIVLNWVLVVIVGLATFAWVFDRLRGNVDAVRARFPVEAVAYLQDSGLSETRIYNHYDWGGFLIWHRIPVFIDGRTELYGDEFLMRYLRTFQVRSNWELLLNQYNIKTVFMKRSSALSTLLAASDDWREVYGDNQARIFVRGEPLAN